VLGSNSWFFLMAAAILMNHNINPKGA
jgi:hypothetical protein